MNWRPAVAGIARVLEKYRQVVTQNESLERLVASAEIRRIDIPSKRPAYKLSPSQKLLPKRIERFSSRSVAQGPFKLFTQFV